VVPAARLAPTEIARYRVELARLLPPRITSPRKVVGVSGATGIDLTGFGTVVVSQRTAGGQMATRCADTVEEAIEFLSPTDPSPGLPVK
jgi:hypothetical protein